MSWTELLKRAAEESGLQATVVRKVMGAYWEGIREALLRGESVAVPGWGVFRRVELKPKVLKTGREERFVPSVLAVRFRPSRTAREAVQRKGRSSG